MTRYLLIPIGALALASCSSEPAGPPSAEDVAKAAENLVKPTPGLYRSTATVTEFEIPGLPPEQYGRIVRYEEPTPAPAPEYYAQAEPTRTRMLPTTAGPLPWFATAGVVALLGGVGLRRARKE